MVDGEWLIDLHDNWNKLGVKVIATAPKTASLSEI
jgi:hypothetical protein